MDCGDAVKLRTPEGQLAFHRATFHPCALPLRIVGILDRQWLQLRRLPIAVGGVEHGEFAYQDVDRPAIRNDVVHINDHHVFFLGQGQEVNTDEGRQRKVVGSNRILAEDAMDFILPLGRRQRREVYFDQWQVNLIMDALDDAVMLLHKVRAQHFMPLNDIAECARKRCAVENTFQAIGTGHVVLAAPSHPIDEPQAVLCVGERSPAALDHPRLDAGHTRCVGGLGHRCVVPCKVGKQRILVRAEFIAQLDRQRCARHFKNQATLPGTQQDAGVERLVHQILDIHQSPPG
ncbi:hypothetical protein D3C71_782250 [compost metagenome]